MSSPTEQRDRPSAHDSTDPSTPGPSTHPSPPPRPRPRVQPPPSSQKAPESSFVDRLPSIRLSVPPRGRFSPATSERCITYCSQSHFGRAHGNEPKCYTLCLRRIFNHEVNRVLTNVNYGPTIKSPTVSANIPLPQEANTTLGQYISDSPGAEVSDGPTSSSRATTPEHPENSQRHWQEGYYVWLSHSRQAASEHMSHMKRDLLQQAAYEHSKAMWARAVREGRQNEFYRTPEAHVFGSEWTANMNEDILSPPYRRMLFPLSTPAPELRRVISKYLAPTSVILTTLRESFTSGDQVKFAHRMRESIEEGAPWALARNVGRKIWGLLSGEGEG